MEGTGILLARIQMFATARGTAAWNTRNNKKRNRKDAALAPR